jgi:uncharacterized membrane-anchored protein
VALNDILDEIEEEKDKARMEGLVVGVAIGGIAVLVIGVIGYLFSGSPKK